MTFGLSACGGGGLDPIGAADGSMDAMADGAPDADASPPDSSVVDSSVPPDTSVADATPPVMDSAPPLVACTVEELQPIVECAADACVSLPDGGLGDASLPDSGELATCIVTNCGVLVFGVSSDCRGCLLAGVSMDLETIAATCAPGVMVP